VAEKDVNIAGDIAQGVGAGLIGLPQGITETGAAIIDYTLGTNFRPEATDFFESSKNYLGLTPETAAGETVEAITTFATAFIPVAGWLGRASAVANRLAVAPAGSAFTRTATKFGNSAAGKALLSAPTSNFSRRARLAATTSLAGGAAEMIVAPDGTGTLADTFTILPEELRTVDESGLLGRDAAAQTLSNKFKIGVEASVVGLAAEGILPAVGLATRGASMIPGMPAVAGGISNGFEFIGRQIDERVFKGGLTKYFTPAGGVNQQLYEEFTAVKGISQQEARLAEELLTGFDNAARKVVKKQGIFAKTKPGVQKAYDDLLLFLEGDKDALADYGTEVVNLGTKMRGQIDRLSDMAVESLRFGIESGDINADIATAAIKEIERNKGAYLRRLYEQAFVIDPAQARALTDNPKYRAGVKKYTEMLIRGGAEPEEAAREAAETINETLLRGKQVDPRLSPEATMELAKRGYEEVVENANRRPLITIAEDMFSQRAKFLDKVPEIRELMGEIRDPRKLFLTTVGDLAKTITANDFYQALATSYRTSVDDAMPQLDAYIANGFKGPRPLVISGENANEQLLKQAGYVRLGTRRTGEAAKKTIYAGKYGALSGDFVQKELYNALTQPIRSSNIVNELLSASLLAKGLSQMGKTVLNPVGQIRNFISGTFMVGANGNIPRHVELDEALKLAYGKVGGQSTEDFDRFHGMIGDLGLRDENLAVEEYKNLLREASGMKTEKLAYSAGSLLSKMPGVQFAQKMYADTDTYWKTVGFIGERGKYGAAFRAAGINADEISGGVAEGLVNSGLGPQSSTLVGRHGFLNVLAGDVVKETMPTYSRVPEIIKGIRRIPVAGNFVAFPAEVIRNTTNILNRGLKDMAFKASDDLVRELGEAGARRLEREIRAIGANRIASYVASAGVIPTAIVKASLMTNKMTEEDLDDIKKFALPYYMAGHQVAIIGKPNNKGDFVFADLSYMMPFDFVIAPAREALEVMSQKGELGQGDVQRFTAGAWAAFTSIMEPFAGESLVAERVMDALPVDYFGRGGKTATGATIWDDVNDQGTKLQKSMFHILGGFNPEVTRLFFDIKPEGLVPGRLTRAATGDPDRLGRTLSVDQEALAFITGIRPQQGNVFDSLKFEGYNFTDLRSQASGSFTRVAKANDSTVEDVLQAYTNANADALRAQQDMYQKIQGLFSVMDSAGVPKRTQRTEVIRALKEAKLGNEEIGFLLQGRFRPITLNQQTFREVWAETAVQGQERKISQLPIRGLLKLRNSFIGRKLQEPVEETSSRETRNLNLSAAQQPAPSAPSTGAVSPSVAAPPSATVAPVPSQAAAPDPSLLGGNPIDILKNMTIAQRTP
jgi:hypothetical protein